MNIAIVGGGAIGLLFAGYLTKANHNVTVIVRREEQVKQINEQGVVVEAGERSRFVVKATTPINQEDINYDLLIVTVKQGDVSNVITSINDGQIQAKAVLFVQNGMGHFPYLQRLKANNIYIGVVEHGAKRMSNHEVNHTGKGQVMIGAFRQNDLEIKDVVKNLSTLLFPVHVSDDWLVIVKEKLVVNAVINPLTALYRIENGKLLDNEHFKKVMKKLFLEAVEVLQLQNHHELWERIMTICKKTASNHSSMKVDVDNGKETEIEAINGYIISMAKERTIDVPYNTFVYESIKGVTSQKLL